MKKASEILEEVYRLIEDESRWVTRHGAVNDEGLEVGCTSPTACRWCFEGALAKVLGLDDWVNVSDDDVSSAYMYAAIASDQMAGEGCKPWWVNDTMGHAATLDMTRMAIDEAKSQED